MLDKYNQTLKNTTKLTDEKLLSLRDELKSYRDDSQALLDQVNDEFKTRMEAQGVTELPIAHRKVKLIFVPLFGKVTIAVARQFKAVKMAPNTKRLAELFEEGQEIPGMTSYTKIDIR